MDTTHLVLHGMSYQWRKKTVETPRRILNLYVAGFIVHIRTQFLKNVVFRKKTSNEQNVEKKIENLGCAKIKGAQMDLMREI